MKYWDSSAIVPLLIEQAFTPDIVKCYKNDSSIATWWGTQIECASALSRLERENICEKKELTTSFSRLDKLRESWQEISPSDDIKRKALRLLRTHNIRAADALQLAAAITFAEAFHRTTNFVCLDARLADAARKEGFNLILVAD